MDEDNNFTDIKKGKARVLIQCYLHGRPRTANHTRPSPRKHSPDVTTPIEMAEPDYCLLIYRPRMDERLSWPSWLTCSGWFTHISGHPSAAGRAQDRESSPAKDQPSTTEPRNQPVTFQFLPIPKDHSHFSHILT